MLIAGLAIGIATGSIAAIVALILGAGFLNAFVAYTVAGIIGMCAVLMWTLLPQRNLPKDSDQPTSNMSVSWQSAPIVETRYAHRKGADRNASRKSGLSGRSARRQNQA